ncbi:tRNA 2-thiouridine(34) synthase MnmA [Clostridium botulinum C]|uniref:tRNA-specific 2-thiouridylase MnmA n=3 Tax=Clostridium botulinum TaxID=1491 RepID=A0A9Q4TK31_CLOBO|nr:MULTISPECIES: tRNA 2-thiouridine(34) synthase MnmA [Clostridium]EGO86924.1 thiouridylase [Clostridium botulinum C str. Stockholm]EES91729.1 tRNA (5-methylaminomethyl-2-thiouridylate)-methyltransferase [Clostridium botulinum D str. 1873]MBO3441778.1 tRNA 2-thiouridine(34) synthase MnmA [Clostridium haemolyticum]MCD3194438.1 tRNA 2-thiouridine(34) synthase MnmA [Clostridium botulinum C]MCD3199592.1 tRNA 2-thiouridine(34) synthase MnmA [Clostridium botulinum C]
MSKKVAIGLSGGVDSSVAAYLLKEKGYDLIGITMKVSDVDVSEDAAKIAQKLDIPYHILDLRDEFKNHVIDNFAKEYLQGRTPNPCAMCNKYIKFGVLLQKAKELGADYIATGHYARVEEHNGRYLVLNAKDDKKDQTYMFYSLTQDVLKHILMPCGEYTKVQIREIARNLDLEVHDKKESMDICFIPDNDHGKYIQSLECKDRIKPGNFVDKQGNILGKHKGLIYYTIGQRKGLGLSLGKPGFVVDIIPERNEVVVGDESEIFNSGLIAKDINFIPFDSLENPMEVEAKIRYSTTKSKATIIPFEEGKVKVVFEDKQRAITKGQRVVFYIQDMLLGGGTIEDIVK